MKGIYYNYCYIDPRKPGKNVYEGCPISFLFEPIYIGKGTGDRYIKTHGRNDRFQKMLTKLRSMGFDLGSCVIRFNVGNSEDYCYNQEENLINIIGRSDLKFGPLLNMNNGGTGGLSPSEEVREKIRRSKLGKPGHTQSETTKRKISSSLRGRKLSNEHRRKISDAQLGTKNHRHGKSISEQHRMAITAANQGKQRSIETRKKISEAQTGERHWNYGKKASATTRMKMRLSHLKPVS